MSAGPRWAVIAAAGRGSRFGGAKQFEDLGGRSLIDIAVGLFGGWDGVVVVLPEGGEAIASEATSVAGGATRRISVAAGLAAVPADAAVIAVHDAARPLATPRLTELLATRLARGDVRGVVPAAPLVDTIKELDTGGLVKRTLPRELMRAVQTPQLFDAAALRAGHEEVSAGFDAPDDASLLEALGLPVAVVDWPEPNPKVTRRLDLEQIRAGR